MSSLKDKILEKAEALQESLEKKDSVLKKIIKKVSKKN